MYTFVRIRKKDTTEYGTWYLKPTKEQDIKDHFAFICHSQIQESMKIIAHNKLHDGPTQHLTNQFGMGVEAYCAVTGEDPVLGALHVENEAYNSRLKAFYKGVDIYLSDGMVVFCLDDRFFEIAEELEKSVLVFPTKRTFTLDDVRYMQWNMIDNIGQHWYAKIDKYDVRDKDENMKWNTKTEAEEASKWFLENVLNK